MMHERSRILRRSVALLVVVSLGAAAVAIPLSYLFSFEDERRHLAGMAKGRAALIAAIGRFDAEFSTDHPDGALGATLSQLREARDRFEGFGETGEYLLVRRDGDDVLFLLDGAAMPEPVEARVAWTADGAESFRRALSGESGSLVGRDHRGTEVLAAYEPVPGLGWAVVAKVDLAEIRAPFVRAGVAAAAIAVVLVCLGVAFLLRLTVPLLQEIERRQSELLDAEAKGRREAEELARENQSRAQAVFDTAVDSILTIDERGVIESVNQTAVESFGYSEEELIGRNISILMPDPYRQEHDGYLERYLETGHARIIGIGREVPCRRRDGSVFPGDLAVSELQLLDRRLFTGVLRDLSERKAAEQKLASAERRVHAAEELASVGTLVAGLAHEIGTPMGVIQGHAKLLEKAVEGDKARWRLQTIQEQIGRISKIIQSLLNMARPKATERIPVALEPLVDTTLSFVFEKFNRRGIEVVRDFKPTPSVTGDPERLQQLLLNLFMNAADAMPDGGVLRVALEPDGSAGASIRISDTGIGIEPENLGRIFEAFYTSKEAGKGNGLGLMVARRIARDHGGDIKVESAPGEGAVFHVRLPWYPTYDG